MKLYKLQRRSDGLFLGGSESRARDRHDHHGRFYSREETAIGALEISGRKVEDYNLLIYEAVLVDTIDYSEVMAETG